MRTPNPTLGNVGTVSVAPQTGPTETTQSTLGGHTVQLGRGQQIRRNIAKFFQGIADKFRSLGNRISAHTAERKQAANVRSAHGAAKSVLKALGDEYADVKMATLLPKLLQKAAKLDPQNPGDKAVELLVATQAQLPISDRKAFAFTDWASMEATINAVIDHQMGRRQLLEETFASIHQTNESDVTSDSDVAELKKAVKSLLTALQARSDDAKIEVIRDEVADYVNQQGVNKGTVFRSDVPVTKAIRSVIKTTYPGCEAEISNVLDNSLPRANALPDDIFKGNKINTHKITAEQFKTVVAVAEDLMVAMIGGDDEEANVDAANSLPTDTVKLLKAIDDEVRKRFPNDDVIAANAFVGSMFLRFQVPFVTLGSQTPERSPKERGVGQLASSLLLSTFNTAATGVKWGSKSDQFKPETATAYADFINKYTDAVKRFREAVIAREVD